MVSLVAIILKNDFTFILNYKFNNEIGLLFIIYLKMSAC